jgi:hypothetical protein
VKADQVSLIEPPQEDRQGWLARLVHPDESESVEGGDTPSH